MYEKRESKGGNSLSKVVYQSKDSLPPAPTINILKLTIRRGEIGGGDAYDERRCLRSPAYIWRSPRNSPLVPEAGIRRVDAVSILSILSYTLSFL